MFSLTGVFFFFFGSEDSNNRDFIRKQKTSLQHFLSILLILRKKNLSQKYILREYIIQNPQSIIQFFANDLM